MHPFHTNPQQNPTILNPLDDIEALKRMHKQATLNARQPTAVQQAAANLKNTYRRRAINIGASINEPLSKIQAEGSSK